MASDPLFRLASSLTFFDTVPIFNMMYCNLITLCSVKKSAPRPTRCSMGGGMPKSSCPVNSVPFKNGNLPFVVSHNYQAFFFLYLMYAS